MNRAKLHLSSRSAAGRRELKLSRAARFRLGASLFIAGALVACALDPLNPQPLPPGPPEFGAQDAGVFVPAKDGGHKTEDSANDTDAATAGSADGGLEPTPNAVDAGDAGDGGSDAAADADATTTP